MNVLNKIKSKKLQKPQDQLEIQFKAAQKQVKEDVTSYPKKIEESEFQSKNKSREMNLNVFKKESTITENDIIMSNYKRSKQKKQLQLLRLKEESMDLGQEGKQFAHCFFVRKGYSIADISIFEGELCSYNEKGVEKSKKKKKISCGIQTICNPQAVNKIYLKDYLSINEEEIMFGSNFVAKIVQKLNNSRRAG